MYSTFYGTITVSFDPFNPFSFTNRMQEAPKCLLNLKLIASFLRPGKVLPQEDGQTDMLNSIQNSLCRLFLGFVKLFIK